MRDYSSSNAEFEDFLSKCWAHILFAIVIIVQWIHISGLTNDLKDVSKINKSIYAEMADEKAQYKRALERNEEVTRSGFYFNEGIMVTKGFFTGSGGTVVGKQDSIYIVQFDNGKKIKFSEDELRVDESRQ